VIEEAALPHARGRAVLQIRSAALRKFGLRLCHEGSGKAVIGIATKRCLEQRRSRCVDLE
jgi:hypothetical protein